MPRCYPAATVFHTIQRGTGFLDLGFERTGYEILWVNEYHEPFLAAYRFSRARLGIQAPRFDYSPASISDFLTSKKRMDALKSYLAIARAANYEIIFAGGPPCPDFSVGGKNKGSIGDNGKLTRTYFELILQLLPDYFVFENVKGLFRTKKHRAFFDEMIRMAETGGFGVTHRLLNALEYGVPQDRERVIVIGAKGQPSDVLDKLLPWDKHKIFDLAQVKRMPWPNTDVFDQRANRPQPAHIQAELTVNYWFTRNNVDNHPNAEDAFRPRQARERFKVIPEGDDSRKSFKRLHRWRFSPTVAYGNNEVHLHPYKPRRLSAAEALALQSLPSEFELPSAMTLSDMFKTIGNGVPFKFAEGIAATLKDFITSRPQ